MHRARSVLQRLGGGPGEMSSWLMRPATRTFNTTPRRINSAAAAEPFLNGSSSAYVEEMYNSWLADPKSVHVVSDHHYIKSIRGFMISLRM